MKGDSIIKKIKCNSAEELIDKLLPSNSLWVNIARYFWIFRGHSRENYQLIPTALRANQDIELGYSNSPIKTPMATNKEQIEAELKKIQEFYWEADAHGLFIPGNPNLLRTPKNWDEIREEINKKSGWPIDDFLPLMALAQHYGIPTRLLDWTDDPFVAAYFAAKGAAKSLRNKDTETNIAVWALNIDWVINEAYPGDKVKKMPIYVVTAPRFTNPNLHAQGGIFTTEHIPSTEIDEKLTIKSVDKIVMDFCKQNKCKKAPMIKFNMPCKEAGKLLRLLNQNSVNAATIFPGYNGVAEAIMERKYWDKREITTYWFRKGLKL